MNHWTCRKCGCDYNYTDPIVVRGYNYCPMCADDEDTTTAMSGTPLHPMWWFLLGILTGILIMRLMQ